MATRSKSKAAAGLLSVLLLAALAGGLLAGLRPLYARAQEQGVLFYYYDPLVENIRAASSVDLPRALVNPYCFTPAVAPHIAAAEAGVVIDFAPIRAACAAARQEADVVIVEGVGGFCVPLGADQGSDDLAVDLGLPVILVVGMRLGCISHALLTAEAIAARGLKLAGWVANRIDPAMSRFEENLAALQSRLKAPLLGVVPHAPAGGAAGAADCLRLPGA